MMMQATCEACGAIGVGYGPPWTGRMTAVQPALEWLCLECCSNRGCAEVLEMVAARRSAKKPAELDDICFENTRTVTIEVEYRNGDEPDRLAQLYRWPPGCLVRLFRAEAPYLGMSWLLGCSDGRGGVYVSNRDVPRIHAELRALRDGVEEDISGIQKELGKMVATINGVELQPGDTITAKVTQGKAIIAIDEVQERVAVPDPYVQSREQHTEEMLADARRDIAYALSRVRAVRMGTLVEDVDYGGDGITLADFRREAPWLVAELVKEVAKL